MGEGTRIAWAHHTFNPWWGCVEVSPACDNCYARTWAKRTGHDVWGENAPRRFFGDKHWNEPLKWNRRAELAGERQRVFCASMADIGERAPMYSDVGTRMEESRLRLWSIIAETPWLDWLLLTKRASFYRAVPDDILAQPNVWPGVTVEDRIRTRRLDVLMRERDRIAGPIWVSYEPGLEWVDFSPWFPRGLRWVVIGGDNSAHARPFKLQWVADTIATCRAAGAVPFVKQLGSLPLVGYYAQDERWREWALERDARTMVVSGGALREHDDDYQPPPARTYLAPRLKARDGADMAEWPEELRVREFPAGAPYAPEATP